MFKLNQSTRRRFFFKSVFNSQFDCIFYFVILLSTVKFSLELSIEY